MSDDPAAPSPVVRVHGMWQRQYQGSHEPQLGQIANVGQRGSSLSPGNGSESPGSPLNGEEVRSPLWTTLDPALLVQTVHRDSGP